MSYKILNIIQNRLVFFLDYKSMKNFFFVTDTIRPTKANKRLLTYAGIQEKILNDRYKAVLADMFFSMDRQSMLCENLRVSVSSLRLRLVSAEETNRNLLEENALLKERVCDLNKHLRRAAEQIRHITSSRS